ncbi:MAG: TolC family protein [Muribaculaceae bacterium]|nr:TolC family protein [Muribaculaceae bacterium]
MNRILFLLLICFSCNAGVRGENQVIPLTLKDAIIRARTNSVDAEMALNQLKIAYWAYRTYKADLLPELSFSATLPSYVKQYSPYMNEDGSYSFVSNNYMQMKGELSLTQNIWLTGGKLSVNSSLDFYRQLGNGSYNQFMSIPFALTLTQPIFGVNNIKWDRKIEPLRYEEAKSAFLSATETVALNTIEYFFSFILAKENLYIAKQNLESAEKLYEVALEKRKMGKISKNDLLQMELNLLEARTDLTDCSSGYNNAMFQLTTFLDFEENTLLDTEIPEEIPLVEISYEDALERAETNNSFSKNMMRLHLEAEYGVAKAKGAQREINLFAQVGFTGTDHYFSGSYDYLNSNQVVQVGFEIPLVDWGKRKGQIKVAESHRKLVESQIRQETMNFRQNLFILVERYGNQLRQVQIASRANEIAQRRYETNEQTFLIGKISTLDLNDSRVKKDEARRNYVNELYLFWYYYYQIRSLTLWDYQNNLSIDSDFDFLLR